MEALVGLGCRLDEPLQLNIGVTLNTQHGP